METAAVKSAYRAVSLTRSEYARKGVYKKAAHKAARRLAKALAKAGA